MSEAEERLIKGEREIYYISDGDEGNGGDDENEGIPGTSNDNYNLKHYWLKLHNVPL